MTPSKPRIYPSSAAFMMGPVVKTAKKSSCLRFLGACAHSNLTREELSENVAAEYTALGHLDEYRYSVKLTRDKIKFEREVPFKVDFRGVTISGRMDFVLEDGAIVEKKSTTSEHVYKRVFESGEPEPAHMAQLASYLAFLQRSEGRLVVTYYELVLDEETKEPIGYMALEEKVFHVQAIDGDIFVDGAKYLHTVKDLARFYAEVEKNVSNPSALPPKPYQGSGYNESPCNFCPLREICVADNNGMTLAEFTEKAIPFLKDKKPAAAFKVKILTARRQVNKNKKAEAKVSTAKSRKDKNANPGTTETK